MIERQWKPRKVVIVGAGAVGSTFAYALAQNGIADEIAIRDMDMEMAGGQVLDLAHGLPFFPSVDIRLAADTDYADAQLIVITAGSKQKPGESRLNLLRRNSSIIAGIIDEIVATGSGAVVLIVSNPVDILSYVALKRSGWERNRVIGSGTVLDSARFRYLLGRHCNIDVHNTHAYILGEHGDSEFAAWSMTNLAGIPIEEYCPTCNKCEDCQRERANIVEEVKNSAYHIIEYKGSTYYAIGLALVRIAAAILRNQRSVLTVSTLLEGEYGIDDVCLSVPSIVSERGAVNIMKCSLSTDEMSSLEKSASLLSRTLRELGA